MLIPGRGHCVDVNQVGIDMRVSGCGRYKDTLWWLKLRTHGSKKSHTHFARRAHPPVRDQGEAGMEGMHLHATGGRTLA